MKNTLVVLFTLSLISCSSFKKLNVTKKIKLDKVKQTENAFRPAWSKNLDPVYNTGNLPIGTSSPFIKDGIVYMGDLRGFMAAYDLANGREIWKVNDKQPINAMANRLSNNIYYGSKTGRFYSRHYATGKLNYSIDLGSPVESQPIFTQGRALIHLRNHTIVCLDAETGKVFWRYKRSIPYTTTLQRVSKVMPYRGQLIVGFADGNVVSLSLEEGVVKWEQKISTGIKFVDVDVSGVIFNGKLIFGAASGPMRFLNLKNGVIERTVEFSQAHTPLISDDNLIVGSTFGDLYKVDKFAKIIKRKKLSENSISSVYPYKRGYIVATMGSEVFYVNQEFKVLDQFSLGSEQSAVFGEIVGEADSFSLYSSRNRLYVFN